MYLDSRSRPTRDAVLGLDPRTTPSMRDVENGPRIKPEGSPVRVEAASQ